MQMSVTPLEKETMFKYIQVWCMKLTDILSAQKQLHL